MMSAPSGFGQALSALDLYLGPSYEVAIIGDLDAMDTHVLVHEVVRRYWRPNGVLAVAPPGDTRAAATVPLLASRNQVDGKATGYVCHGFVCDLPATSPSDLALELHTAVT
jgi:uncharacterized protein YyaL (SSP411 family)